jgi:type IV secretion system protein VirB11
MALKRLESLIQEAVITVPRELISEAIDMVVYIERTPQGRVVREII